MSHGPGRAASPQTQRPAYSGRGPTEELAIGGGSAEFGESGRFVAALSEASMPTKVSTHVTSATYTKYRGIASRKLNPRASDRRVVLTVYIPTGNTIPQY